MFLATASYFGPKELEVILKYLTNLPAEIPVFIELRHPEWFVPSNSEFEKLIECCQTLNKGLVITDTVGRRDVLHNRLTQPQAFIRFVGNSLHTTDYSRIDEWIEKLKSWFKQGLEELYFFMHMHDEKESPDLCHYFIAKLNEECNLNVKLPQLIKGQNTLF